MTRRGVLAFAAALGLLVPTFLVAQTATVSVPFVGCPSEGQGGAVEAPKGARVSVAVTREAAEQLAYYKSWPELGVLAPRGWHCFGTFGSDGESLFVTPELADVSRALLTPGGGLPGDAIVIQYSLGGTSGRFRVAEIIARIFPEYLAFVQRVREMFDYPADRFPSGPYPADKLVYLGPRVVEFRTPAQADGLGTDGWLRKTGAAIDGVAILVGDPPNLPPDLLLLAVRLPRDLAVLAPTIVHQMELDAK